MIQVLVKAIVKNPPMALIVFGVLAFLMGSTQGAEGLMRWGNTLIGLGVVLHVLWLILRRGR